MYLRLRLGVGAAKSISTHLTTPRPTFSPPSHPITPTPHTSNCCNEPHGSYHSPSRPLHAISPVPLRRLARSHPRRSAHPRRSSRAHARRGLITPLVAHPSRRRTCPHAFTLLVAGPSRRRACPHAFTLLVARPARLRACPHIRLDQPQYLIGQRGQKNGRPHEVRNDVYSPIQRLARYRARRQSVGS